MKKSIVLTLTAFVLLNIFNSSTLFASDHVDGPVTSANAVADLTDLYVFQTPGVANSLTMILDVYPLVSSTGHFSDKVTYNLILRTARISADRMRFETDPNSELVISCSFMTPNANSNIQITCQSNDPNHRLKGQVSFNQVAPDLVGNTIQLYAGRRLDPFFLSQSFAAATMKYQKVDPDGKNVLSNLNCLSIVMNVKTSDLFSLLQASTTKPKTQEIVAGVKNSRKVAQAENLLLAVAAESLTSDAGAPRRIDRVGRPEVTNISMNMNSASTGGEIRDSYNKDQPFAVSQINFDRYAARLKKNIGRYDMIDNRRDWNDSQLTQLTTILTDDFLVVDPSVSCRQSQFFAIERALLRGETPHSCGGRDPSDNALNKLYTLYEHGPSHTDEISADAQDGLTGPDVAISDQFPYLNTPDDSIWGAIKRTLGQLFGP